MRTSLQYLRSAVFLVVVFTLAGTTQAAPLGYAGGTITQDFNGLPTDLAAATPTLALKATPHEFTEIVTASGMEGWQLTNAATASGTGVEFKMHNGSLSGSAGRGVVSYGTNGATERALGTLVTSAQINSFGLVLVNNTGTTLDSFTLTYTGEQWRRGGIVSAPFNSLTFSYGLASDIHGALTDYAPLSYSSPNTLSGVGETEIALDGNNSLNQVAVFDTVSGLNWGVGQTLVLRWAAGDLVGQDDGLAIDDFSFSAAAVPEPSAFALGCLALAGFVGFQVKRIRRLR